MAERPFDVITIGDTCVDLLVDLGPVLPQFGQVEQWVEDYHLEMGGSTCIFACQAARLGLRTAVLGKVGADTYGDLILRQLRQCGVQTHFIQVDPGLKTGLGVALCRPDGDRAILTYGGSLNAVTPSDVTDEFLASGRHFHYGSFYLQTRLLPHAPSIVRRAKELGLSLSLDTNWDPSGHWDGVLPEVLRQVDLFLPNENEALAITGAQSVEEALRRLLSLVPTVAIKLGPRGALVGSAAGTWHVPVEPVPYIADTVGAGDNFDAGFVAGWLAGLPLPECAAVGNACGRASILARGGVAGQLRLEEIPQLSAALRSSTGKL